MNSEYTEENGVFLRKSSKADLQKIDSMVLDIDGVVMDVSSSFRVAISKTTQFYFTRILNWTGKAILVSPAETQFFKLAGGFNNDWELTYIAVLFFLAKREQFNNQNLDFLKNRGKSVKDFTKEIAVQGGGLQGVERLLFSTRKPEQVEKIKENWDKNKIKQIFQEIYGGIDYCKKLYGFKPEFIKQRGLINQEKALLGTEDLRPFYPKIGILTGRTKEEARVALNFAAISNMVTEKAVIVDDGGPTKPDPRILLNLGEILNTGMGIYIGDTIDDFKTVANFRAMEPKEVGKIRFLTGIVIRRESEKEMFLDLGADVVAEEPKQILHVLSRLRKGG